MTLDADEFIRRFLLHTLPDGFHRIRHYGFLANGHRADKLALCRKLLSVAPIEPLVPAPGHRGHDRQVARTALDLCPCCGGTMITLSMPAQPEPSRRSFWHDSS